MSGSACRPRRGRVATLDVIPGIVDIDVDIRTLPGEDGDDVEVEVLLHEPAWSHST